MLQQRLLPPMATPSPSRLPLTLPKLYLLLSVQTPFALEDLRVEQADAEEAAERGHHLLILRSEALAVALVEALRHP